MKPWRLLGAVLLVFLCSLTAYGDEPALVWTPEEQAFIAAHPSIRLGVDPKFVPFEFFDTDGTYKGIAADYIELISRKTGIRMAVTPDLTWTEAYEMAVEGDLDVLPCISKTPERERYFLFSDSYYSFIRVIVTRDSAKGIESFDDLGGQTVAVQANSSHHSFLKGSPNIGLSLYPTVEEALTAVVNGKETAFVGNYATSLYLIKTHGLTNLRYVRLDSGEPQNLHFAVRKDWPELVGILNKSLAAITEEERIAINNKWIGVEQAPDFGNILKVLGIIGGIVAGIFAVSLFWILRLKKEIARRIAVEADLKAAKEEAEQANRIKSSFLARMSHEIRTPLSAITGMAYLIKKTEVTLTQRSYLEKIVQAAGNMLGIINDILDFSKIEAGKVEIEKISFNLDRVLQQVITIISFKVEEQGIEFSLEKDPGLPSNFFGDPTRIAQILLNLISNAVKFTEKGTVSVVIRAAADSKGPCRLEFIVRDTGIGMTAQQTQVLFEPFGQADSSINRRFGGTGLGLSIVRSLVEMMEGSICVDSAPGQGSVFSICLPLEADTETEQAEREKSASVYFEGIRTIVLEKHDTSRHLLEIYLKSFNISAEFFSTEADARQAMERSCRDNAPFDLLILDQDTPSQGGLEFARQISSNAGIQPKPKLILMTPLMREEAFENIAEDQGVMGITKPLIPSVLFNAIVEIFRERILEAHEEQSLAGQEAPLYLDRPCHVLVVEDNKTNQFIAKSILEQGGFTVFLAGNGKEGVDVFLQEENRLDVILMDLHMPVMNGYEATTSIRQTGSVIPIIAMTADAVAGVQEECARVGIDRYVSKPFEPEAFIKTIVDTVREVNPQRHTPGEQGPDPVQEAQVELLNAQEGIRRLGNNRELYLMVLKEYLDENREVPQQLRAAIDAARYDEGIQIVHKLKSSTGNIGAGPLWEACSVLQAALHRGNDSEIETLHRQFDTDFEQLRKRIVIELGEVI